MTKNRFFHEKKIEISFLIFLPQKFDMNGSYYCRPRYDKQNKTNPRSLGQKLREEIAFAQGTHFGAFLGFLGLCGGRGKDRKKYQAKKCPFWCYNRFPKLETSIPINKKKLKK